MVRRKPVLYPEVTQVRLRPGTLDLLHRAAEAKRTSAQAMLRDAVDMAIADAFALEAMEEKPIAAE